MAQVTTTTLVDDMDGSEGAETFLFAYDGLEYEIDLSEDNVHELRQTLAAYSQHARAPQHRSRKASKSGSKRRQRGDAPDPAVIRAWAVEQGLEVSARGRLNKTIVDAYFAGH